MKNKKNLPALVHVESTLIKSYRYDDDASTLDIIFKSTPTVAYRYSSVDSKLFGLFAAAKSQGKFFSEFVKPFSKQYAFERLELPEKLKSNDEISRHLACVKK